MKTFLNIIVLCLLTACVAVRETRTADSSKQDWPIFRGSPSLCGSSDCVLSASPQLLWSTSTHTRTVASPIVYHGMVFTLSRKGELRGYSLDGDSLAYYNLGTPVEASFIASDSALYVGRIDGFVTALDIRGLLRSDSEAQPIKPLWQYETMGQISGSPNLVGDLLLVGSYDNSMYTFQAHTGRKTGQFETGYYINGTAAVWQRFMMFGGCDAWVRIVDISTGQKTDSLELDTYVPASPAILDGTALACDYNGNVYEMTLTAEGKIRSHRKLLAQTADNEGQSSGVVSMPTLTRRDAYIFPDERHILCIDRSTGKVRWQKMLRGTAGECSPLVAQDKVLVCTKDGHVSILDSKDGHELWHYETGEQIIASPAIVSDPTSEVGDRFLILTSRGTLLCFN